MKLTWLASLIAAVALVAILAAAAAQADLPGSPTTPARPRRVLCNFDGDSCLVTKAGGKGRVPVTINLRPESPALRLGFMPIPFDKIDVQGAEDAK